jgi:threonine-phosphate decarboxylase
MLYGHGNDKYRYPGRMKADFSSNVWYQPLPAAFYDHLKNAISRLQDYPSPDASGFKQELARFHDLSVDNIWAANGSIEGIYLIAQAFSGKSSAVIYPCFSEYEDACKRYNHRLSFYPDEPDWHKQSFSEELVWFGNPNNPDGKKIGLAEVESLLVNNPGTIFIIDEAYAGLHAGFESAIPLLKKYSNLIILCSFTKAFAIPGIRLGHVLASKEVIRQLAGLSISWSVNTMAIEAGKFILQNYEACLPEPGEVAKETKLFQAKLNEITELSIHPSECNFFLVELKTKSSAEVKKYLAEKFGILIRDASNFRGLDERFIRLSVQKEEHIEMLVTILKEWLP